MEPKQNVLLSSYTEQEKTAYLTALAALATSDREATDKELLHLREVASNAGLSEAHEKQIIEAAQDVSGENLKNALDQLKQSDLRYGLITDLIALAHADGNYTEEEKGNIEKVSQYLNLNQDQFSVLDQFVKKAATEDRTPEELSKPNFLNSTGMQDKFSNAGFNMQSLGKSIFGFLGPLLLGGLASRTLRRNSGSVSGQRGGLGGMLGGLLSGNGSLTGMGGGLGSLLSGLSGSRNTGAMGGILGRLFR